MVQGSSLHDADGSIRKLSDERQALARNNDELLVQIAKNSADKAYIQILEAHLKHLRQDAACEIDLKTVSEHLSNELEKAKQAKNVHEKQHAIKLEEERKLKQDRNKLKRELEAMIKEHKDLQDQVRTQSKICDAKAKERIDVEQQVVALERQKRFEETHFDLIEMAIKTPGKYVELETPKADNGYLQKMLDEYSNKFDSEYQKLLNRAKREQKEQLEAELYNLNKQIEEKNKELKEVDEEINKLMAQLEQTQARLDIAKKRLAVLKQERDEQRQGYEKQRNDLEAERKELEEDINRLVKSIDETRDRANESLKIVIQLEFEIKAYEKMLVSGKNHLSYRSYSRSSSSSRSSKSSNSVNSRNGDKQHATVAAKLSDSSRSSIESIPKAVVDFNLKGRSRSSSFSSGTENK